VTALDEQPAPATLLARTLADRATAAALDWLAGQTDRFVAGLTSLAEIPAPTFAEGTRAEHMAARLRELGLEQVQIDAAGNVLGCLGADLPGSGVALLAHMDTVFPAETNLRVRRHGGRLYGPGIGDNSAGLMGLLMTLEAMRVAGVQLRQPIWAVATTGEEGLGDLRGARAAVQTLRGRIDCAVAIEGALLGRVTHAGVGSLRWRVHFSGPGGHSWHDFGRPSAINAAALAITELTRLSVPTEPRTTFNVGAIEGGIGVNVIASEASFLLDMRSLDARVLQDLVRQAEHAVRRASEREGVEVEIATVGDRPAGSIPRDHPLVETAAAVLRHLGLEPRYEAASTDANIPLSLGIPAITVGITHGGGIHTEEEWLEIQPCVTGVGQLLLLVLTLTAAAHPAA
jgi:tripeptide aminopeptidase